MITLASLGKDQVTVGSLWYRRSHHATRSSHSARGVPSVLPSRRRDRASVRLRRSATARLAIGHGAVTLPAWDDRVMGGSPRRPT
jgi:hypothetical protein